MQLELSTKLSKKFNFQKICTILTLICFISSCTSSSTTPSRNTSTSEIRTNASCKEPYKSFSVKSLMPEKANQAFRIKIQKKLLMNLFL